jgi:hypothetical protein
MLLDLKDSSRLGFRIGRFSEALSRWPVAVITLGLVITIAWSGLLIWLLARFLYLVCTNLLFHTGHTAMIPAIIALLYFGAAVRDSAR